MKNKEIIEKAKAEIAALNTQTDAVYDKLCRDLNIESDERTKDWLFDYVYNDFDNKITQELMEGEQPDFCPSCGTGTKFVDGVCHGTHIRK